MNLLITFTCFTLCSLPSIHNGFLLEDRTQPPTQPAAVLYDNHFNMLLSLLVEEKQARVNLENEVQQLRKELFVTQQAVTSNYHAGQNHNHTLTSQTSTLINLDDKYTALQIKYDSLKLEFNELKTNYFILQNQTIHVNQEIDVPKVPNRVALVAGVKEKIYQPHSIILFPYIHLRNGTSSNGVTSFESTGKFVCERPGLYLITVFLSARGTSFTQDEQQWIYLYQWSNRYKSNWDLAYIYFSTRNSYRTHTASIIVQFNVNDAVFVQNGDHETVLYGDSGGRLSILQLTD